MYRNVFKVIILAVSLHLVGCGKDNVHYDTYEQVEKIEPGLFETCWWVGQMEYCRWEHVTCYRNWAFTRPVFTCRRR